MNLGLHSHIYSSILGLELEEPFGWEVEVFKKLKSSCLRYSTWPDDWEPLSTHFCTCNIATKHITSYCGSFSLQTCDVLFHSRGEYALQEYTEVKAVTIKISQKNS